MAVPATWDAVADSYATHIMPVFESYAREALRVAKVEPKSDILDVATGPGTLALMAAGLGHTVTAVDFSRSMIDCLQASAAQRQVQVDARVGDGMALELPADRFHAAFSMFGLIFFPQRGRGFSELWRVLRPGGKAVVASWGPLDQIPFLSTVYSTLAELVPTPSGPPPRMLDSPEACLTEMGMAGFSDVSVERVTFAFESPSLAQYWATFPGSCAPLCAMSKQVGAAYPGLLEKIYSRLVEKFGPGAVRIEMPAFLTCGVKV